MIQAESLSRRPLGKTGLEVSPLCVGCAPLGKMSETFAYSVAEDQALAPIRAIFASPINFLDTAAVYDDGESERRLGIVLHESVNKASLDYYEKFFAEKWDSKFVMVRRAEAFLAGDTAD